MTSYKLKKLKKLQIDNHNAVTRTTLKAMMNSNFKDIWISEAFWLFVIEVIPNTTIRYYMFTMGKGYWLTQ